MNEKQNWKRLRNNFVQTNGKEGNPRKKKARNVTIIK